MDIISHALWGGTVIRKKPLTWWAFLTGALPDILGGGPAFFYLLFAHHKLWTTDAWQLLPEILRENYSFWHTIFGTALVFSILMLFGKKFEVLIFPYLLHIAMDLYTHVSDPLARLFSPLISYNPLRETGLNWWEYDSIWIINVVLLIGVNIFIWTHNHHTKRDIG